jgi:membrane protein involved in colicin uptake
MTDHEAKADAAAAKRTEDEKKRAEEAKKKLGEERKAREEASKVSAKEGVQASTPTPTQEENDLAVMGCNVMEKEDDGSGPEPVPGQTKQVEAKPAQRGTYETRAVNK